MGRCNVGFFDCITPGTYLQTIVLTLSVLTAFLVIFIQIRYDKRKIKKQEAKKYIKGCLFIRFYVNNVCDSFNRVKEYIDYGSQDRLDLNLSKEYLSKIKYNASKLDEIPIEYVHYSLVEEFFSSKVIITQNEEEIVSHFDGYITKYIHLDHHRKNIEKDVKNLYIFCEKIDQKIEDLTLEAKI